MRASRVVSSAGRARRSHRRGHWFKSSTTHHFSLLPSRPHPLLITCRPISPYIAPRDRAAALYLAPDVHHHSLSMRMLRLWQWACGSACAILAETLARNRSGSQAAPAGTSGKNMAEDITHLLV